MRSKVSRSILLHSRASKSRREFLQYGAAAAGASILIPLWPRWAAAQTASFDYYISTTGSDSNPGTLSQPWALTSLLNPAMSQFNSSISANQTAMRGKRIGVLPGTYNCAALVGGQYNTSSTGSDFDRPAFCAPAGLSASQPTLLQSTTPLGAIIDGGMTDANNPGAQPLLGTAIVSSSQYIIIDGFEVRNSNDKIMAVGGNTGNSVASIANGITVRNCYIHGCRSTSSGANPSGITFYACIGALCQNNYITNIVNTSNRNSGIEFWSSTSCIIEYNTVVMNNGGAGAIYVKDKNQNHIIRYNYCDTSAAPSLGGSGTIGRDSTGTNANSLEAFYNNIVFGDNPFEGDVAGAPLNYTANQTFYNNTLVANGNWSNHGMWIEGASPGQVRLYNNIFSRGTVGTRGDVGPTSANQIVLIDYNLYPSSFHNAIGTNGFTTLASWQAIMPAGSEAHSVLGAPTFLGGSPALASQKYKLQAGSLGKGTGSSDGTTGGTACDMGAWGGIDRNTGLPPAQIGCNFAPGVSAPPPPPLVPSPPVLSVS